MDAPQVGETAEKVVEKVEATVKEAKQLIKKVKVAAAKPKAPAKKSPPKKVAPVKKAPAPKPAAKKVKEPVKIKGAQLLKKGPGPAMVKLANKIKVKYEPGECRLKGCGRKAVTKRAKWCATHKKAIRKLQLKANNATWRPRVKAGTAGHHVVYDGQATVFTLKNKPLAEKIVAAGRATITTKTELEKAIAAVPMAQRKEIRSA